MYTKTNPRKQVFSPWSTMGCNKLERRKSGTHIPKGWRVRGERPYVQMGHDGDRSPWPARNRLCAQGNWLDDKPSRIGRTFGNWVHKQDRRSTMAPPYPPDWWHSPASGEVSARAVLKCLKKELEARGELNSVDACSAGPVPEIPTVDPDWEEQYIDDVNGGILPAEEVRKARAFLHK